MGNDEERAVKASLSLLLERNRESTVASYTSQLPAIMKRITIVYRFTVDLSNYVLDAMKIVVR